MITLNLKFNVFINGIEPGFSKEIVAKHLSILFKTSEEIFYPILEQERYLIKKSVDIRTASKYENTLKKCGCTCLIEQENQDGIIMSIDLDGQEKNQQPKNVVATKEYSTTANTPSPLMVFCRGCGKEIYESASICPNCGKPQDVKNLTKENRKWGNAMAWLIAFSPLIGAFVGALVSKIFHVHGENFLLIVSLAINIYLCTKDEKDLKISGIDTTKIEKEFIIPFYLYKRSTILNEEIGYSIVWCLLFLAQLGIL